MKFYAVQRHTLKFHSLLARRHDEKPLGRMNFLLRLPRLNESYHVSPQKPRVDDGGDSTHESCDTVDHDGARIPRSKQWSQYEESQSSDRMLATSARRRN